MSDPLPRFVSLPVALQELGLPEADDPDNPHRDEIIGRILDYCTKKFQEKAGSPIFSGTYTHRIDGGYRTDLWPAITPIISINSLTDSGIAIPAAGGGLSGYEFDDDHVWLVNGFFSQGRRNVVLDFVGGYSTDAIPADIVEVNIEQMRLMWLRRPNISQLSEGMAGQTTTWERGPLSPRFLECAESYKNVAWLG